MAIHIREEEVTRQQRRMKSHAQKTHDRRMKLEIRHSKQAPTRKAFIEALEQKHRNKSVSKADKRLAMKLRAATTRYRRLAHMVTTHISVTWNGIVWGESLDAIYQEIAEAIGETVADIKYAVDIAESMKLLHREEADDISVAEWVCVDLSAA